MDANQYCQEKAAKSGSSFYYAFLFLTPARRAAITALYAFCREVDDIVDECSDASVARLKLNWWRSEIQQTCKGLPTHPVMLALYPHLTTYSLSGDRLLAIIDGMEMDLNQTRYLDWIDLSQYCWHVAGVVGELSARIFGYTDANTLKYAEKLGLAFQMTNIIRDIGDDARRGRIYLPMNELQQFNVQASDILNSQYSDRFTQLMQFQTTRAHTLYREAMLNLAQADYRAQRPGLMMAAIYHALLDEIEQEGWQVLHQRIELTPLRKFWLAWKTWVGGGRSLINRLSQ